ncbi:sensor histidine kinase [Phosphitispora sp. TUW77]|uniref:sensor histidine kinase n=1 Tax=Phosphitispora sp. TUW77 TaxID=3152361 RepID=UPI003AB16796
MIKNRLFVKILATYLCIIISTLAMLGVLLSFLLNNYFIYNKQMEMMVKANDITKLVKPFLANKRDPGELIGLLNFADSNLGTEIWVIDSKGFVIAAAANQKAHEGDLLNAEDLLAMQQGKVITRKGKSQLYDETVLWVINPIEENNRIIGGIIVYAPIIGIALTMIKVRNLFIYSAAVSIVFSTIVVYFLSKYVTGPLHKMNSVAKQLASGNFAERVSVKQGDEIGDLGMAFNHMASEIEKSEKVRRDFLADVSHELRSPLTIIQGFIEAMIDGKDTTPEKRKKYLGILHDESLRLGRLVNELLDLSKMESGTMDFIKEPIDIAKIVCDTAIKVRAAINDKEIKVYPDYTGVSIIVLGNRDRLEQVMTNLLDNAFRFAPSGSEIGISLSESEADITVTVRDEGKGIPEEELPYIWERFYKVDKARNRAQSGTGLGLAIVKHIVQSLGGRVFVSSSIGSGTEIGFVLPKANNGTKQC